MSNINTVAVSGNLTRDPELKTFGDDGKVANLGIAVNRQRKDAGGDYVDEVSFFDVTVWGNFAGLVCRKLRKGDSCTIMGRLEQQTWEKDGEKKSKVVIIASTIDSDGFFRSKDEDRSEGESQSDNFVPANTPSGEATESAASTTAADDDIPF